MLSLPAMTKAASRKCWLSRAVDQGGYMLDEIVQTRRNSLEHFVSIFFAVRNLSSDRRPAALQHKFEPIDARRLARGKP